MGALKLPIRRCNFANEMPIQLQHKDNNTMKRYITLTAMRNHRFKNAYRRAAKERLEANVSRLVDRVLKEPVKQGFFVSADHLLVMNRRRKAGTLPKNMSDENRRMWDEIFSVLDDLCAKHPGMTLTEAACRVVSGATASRFYISPKVAMDLVKNECGQKTV